MRMMVFFDLPVKTKIQRRAATRFRSFLLKDGYFMMQYSVYCRVCNGIDAVEQHNNGYDNRDDNADCLLGNRESSLVDDNCHDKYILSENSVLCECGAL